MDSNGPGSVQYDRWNEDNINMDVEASQSPVMGLSDRVCVCCDRVCIGVIVAGRKAIGIMASLVAFYIMGYVTGYYIHRC